MVPSYKKSLWKTLLSLEDCDNLLAPPEDGMFFFTSFSVLSWEREDL